MSSVGLAGKAHGAGLKVLWHGMLAELACSMDQ